jgi:hypothetical protein
MGQSPSSVLQEIDYLSNMINVPCDQIRHTIISANKVDPLDYAPECIREAHLFADPLSAQALEFARIASPLGIMRKWDCKPEPGQADNICYLAPTDRMDDFERLAEFMSLPMQWGVVTTPKALVNFTPPMNNTWVVTYVAVRSLNPTVYLAVQIADPPGRVSDMRSDDFDWNGRTNAWFEVKGNSIWSINNIVTYAWFNKPVLLAFQGGQKVRLIVQRNAASLPADDFRVHVAIHGYICPAEALSKLSTSTTLIQQKTA